MFPPAIIYINGNIDGYGLVYGDFDSIGKSTLESQLKIDETLTGEEFDLRLLSNPNYVTLIHNLNYRIMIIRNDYINCPNREYADVILHVKYGQASVLKNNCGPHGVTYPISRINVYELLRYNNSAYVKKI